MDLEGHLDQVDWALLLELQQNARMNYTELGRRVGLTAPAVVERIRRMEEAGVITGYRVDLNMEKVGRPLRAVVRITTADAVRSSLAVAVRQFLEVLECHRVTGEDCYIMKVALASPRHLEEFIDRLSAFGKTTTCIVLSSPVAHRVVGPLERPAKAAQDGTERALA